jgi:hypothetical protein
VPSLLALRQSDRKPLLYASRPLIILLLLLLLMWSSHGNVTNRTYVYVGLRPFKFLFCHFRLSMLKFVIYKLVNYLALAAITASATFFGASE